MTIDYGRQNDIQELAQAISEAKTQGEREYYEKIAHKILNESDRIKHLREQLIKASRANDRRTIEKICNRIQYVRMDETYGKSWGSNKGNRYAN